MARSSKGSSNGPDTDAQDQRSPPSFSACSARPIHTNGPIADNEPINARRPIFRVRGAAEQIGVHSIKCAADTDNYRSDS